MIKPTSSHNHVPSNSTMNRALILPSGRLSLSVYRQRIEPTVAAAMGGLAPTVLKDRLVTTAALIVIGIAWTQVWVGFGVSDGGIRDQQMLGTTLLIQLVHSRCLE